MAKEVRSRMVEGAVRLLARQGLQATSFSEVLELTGAPRGSVYHHFPGGKPRPRRAPPTSSASGARSCPARSFRRAARCWRSPWRRIRGSC